VLPNPLRYATLATIALGAIVSFGSIQGMRLAFVVDELNVSDGETPFFNKLTPNPEAYSAAQRAQGVAIRGAIEGMRWPRVAILFGLSSATALVFVAALRLRWPSGLHRAGLAMLLSRAATGAAVLRTLDGAQELVIVRAAVAGYEKALREHQVDLADSGATLTIFSFGSVVTTLVVVGLFLAASSYFKSERIQQTFLLLDRNTPEEE
jgi:hypothetical protein